MSNTLDIKPANTCRFDLVSLGEVMLRLDPGEGRIHTTRSFHGMGGRRRIQRRARPAALLRAAHAHIVTALADNPVGRLVEDLMLQGGVDLSYLRWVPYDGVGRSLRNGLNFTERGFGVRGAVGCSDRGHTAVSQLAPATSTGRGSSAREGARWLHTGGIFCALSETTPAVAREAMEAAHAHGTSVSYDLNYRDSLWRSFGGQVRARAVNRALAAVRRCACSATRRTSRRRWGSSCRASTSSSARCDRRLPRHDRRRRRRVPQHQGRRHDAAHRTGRRR